MSVRPSVRPQKVFSDFDQIWCVGRSRPDMPTRITSIRSKVKVKVTELPKLRKLHYSMSISSTVFAWSSKLMVVGNSMVPGLQLVGARFLNFLGKLSQEFKLRRMSTFHEIQMAIFRYCVMPQSRVWAASSPTRTVYVDVTLTRSKVKVTEHLNFRQLPITAHFCVYRLRHFRVELKTDAWCSRMGPAL